MILFGPLSVGVRDFPLLEREGGEKKTLMMTGTSAVWSIVAMMLVLFRLVPLALGGVGGGERPQPRNRSGHSFT
jgi:hypothetical protein